MGTPLLSSDSVLPDDYDPLLKFAKKIRGLSPIRFALFFAVGSFSTACLAAWIEGRLFYAEPGVLPLWENFSTLVDFLLLNPLACFYIIRCYQAMGKVKDSPGRHSSRAFSCFLLIGAIASMGFYIRGFFDGEFLDASYIGGGLKGITATGWVVSFWTTLYLYMIFQCASCQARYISAILKLRENDLDYHPLQTDGAGGLRHLAQPALEFLRFLAVLLATFIVFYLYDSMTSGVHGNNRYIAAIMYMVFAPILFFTPILHLHRLMKKSRDHLLKPLDFRLTTVLCDLETGTSKVSAVSEELEAITKVENQIKSFPTWPLPVRQMLESGSYLIGPALTYLPKLLALLKVI